MASPVTAINTPGRNGFHVLFTLNENNQLALENRPYRYPQYYDKYRDHGTSAGVIVNPAQIASVVQEGLVTVYGIATSGPKDKPVQAVSLLSPIYNPLSNTADNGNLLTTTLKGVAAAGNDEDGHTWIFFTRMKSDDSGVQLVGLDVKSAEGSAAPIDLGTKNRQPSSNTNLAAVFQDHFIVVYSNTDDEDNTSIFSYDQRSENS